MLNNRLLFSTARRSTRGGFTLVELLVVIGIIAILASVALGPIMGGIEKAKESSGMQTARSINLLLFSYSNDNNQTYPPGGSAGVTLTPPPTDVGTSEGIAIQLLQGGYATDPTIFAIGSTQKYTGAGAPYADFAKTNISFDFTGGAAATAGITSSASDLLPLVYCTGETVAYPPTANAGLNLTLSGNGPFKFNGIAVGYKSNSAVFMKGIQNAAASAVVNGFISTSCSDVGPYTQIKP